MLILCVVAAIGRICVAIGLRRAFRRREYPVNNSIARRLILVVIESVLVQHSPELVAGRDSDLLADHRGAQS